MPDEQFGGYALEIRIRVDGQQPDDDMRSLHSWLQKEDELRGRVSLLTSPPAVEEMGSFLEGLAVALGSGGAITVLAQSVSMWLTQRHSDITVEVSHGDRTIKVTANRAKDAGKLIRDVLDSEHGR